MRLSSGPCAGLGARQQLGRWPAASPSSCGCRSMPGCSSSSNSSNSVRGSSCGASRAAAPAAGTPAAQARPGGSSSSSSRRRVLRQRHLVTSAAAAGSSSNSSSSGDGDGVGDGDRLRPHNSRGGAQPLHSSQREQQQQPPQQPPQQRQQPPPQQLHNQQQQQHHQQPSMRLLRLLGRAVGPAAALAVAAAFAPRPSHAAAAERPSGPPIMTQRHIQQQAQQAQQPSSSRGWRLAGVGNLAAGGSNAGPAAAVAEALPRPSKQQVDAAVRSDPGLQQLIAAHKAAWYKAHPSVPSGSGFYEARLNANLGIPLDFDALSTSMVYAPSDVQERKDKEQIYTFLNAMLNQYDNEDFDLGIKQFMMEQQIQEEMEDGLDKKGDNKDFEEKLAEQLFADEVNEKVQLRESDIPEDAFTTEKMEEAQMVMGPQSSLSTAWRVNEHLQELSYTQLWTLVGEGHVDSLRTYGPEGNNAIVSLKASAPGGARQCKVVLAPDPDLADHLLLHGVMLSSSNSTEGHRLHRAFLIQVARYTMPFVVISAVFWLLHTWILDPVPNKFRRREFIRYRREILHVGTKLNFRSPARQVFIDTTGPEFIGWDDINGIDEVKDEIEEIIDYLKNPALLRLRGVSRIGGVLLAGAPGTGKTLLAKAIAAESGVKMFTCSGTDFYDVYTGVGARRIRETFDMLRNFAPAVLFIDEFDALGAARGAAAGGDESASIINEMLVQMDGFEDNRGLVVLGATNRPGAIDAALIRPGRFDRIIYMPLPDAAGRAKILQVHARNKSVDPTINWEEVARAMSGFTGADCMGLMARAARMAARQGREAIKEDDIYAAMENKAIEAYAEMTGAPQPGFSGVTDPIPHSLRKSIAVYEAGKALIAYITPEYDEIARVSVCPYNIVTGYTLFVEDESARANALLSRGDMEGVMVVHLAGRSAEKLVMGESEMTGLCAADLFHANVVAREMILSAGMGRKVGPMDLMQLHPKAADDGGDLLRTMEPRDASEEDGYYSTTDMPTELARTAMSEVLELLEAAEAKAMYGLAINWGPLQALTEALLDRGVLQGSEVAHILETNGVVHFPDPYTAGFGWERDGSMLYPFKERAAAAAAAAAAGGAPDDAADAQPLVGAAAQTWAAGTEGDAPRNADGSFRYGWHWNSPYKVKRDIPDLFRKEVDRYTQ